MRVVSLSLSLPPPVPSPFSAIKKYAGRNNDRFIRNSAILAGARRRIGRPPDQARTHARSFVRSLAHSLTHTFTSSVRDTHDLAHDLVRTHASAMCRPCSRVGNARFVARVPTTARPSRSLTAFRRTPRRHPRVSLATLAFPRAPFPAGTTDTARRPRGLIASTSRAAATAAAARRHGGTV